VKQKTAKDRFSRALRRFREWCRWHRHDPLKAQHLVLEKKLNGHYAYYGITGNSLAIARLFDAVKHVWRKALERRSQQRLPWRKMQKLLERFPLPAPRIVHKFGT
jgi:RNA-directed DNA polymerase